MNQLSLKGLSDGGCWSVTEQYGPPGVSPVMVFLEQTRPPLFKFNLNHEERIQGGEKKRKEKLSTGNNNEMLLLKY